MERDYRVDLVLDETLSGYQVFCLEDDEVVFDEFYRDEAEAVEVGQEWVEYGFCPTDDDYDGQSDEAQEWIDCGFSPTDDDYDGQPDEAQEWHDFDPDC
jgi:hypothetical protein